MRSEGLTRRGFFSLSFLRDRGSEGPPSPPTDAPRAPRERVLPLPPLPPRAQDGEPTARLRPPGAGSEADFLATCERKGDCVRACPAEALRVVVGGPDAGTPMLEPAVAACLLCLDVMCSGACTTGALRPLGAPSEIALGTAVLDPAICTARRGLPCRACYEVCPVNGVLVLAPGKKVLEPVPGTVACVGCGLCVRECRAYGALHIEPADGRPSGPVRVLRREEGGAALER